MALRITRINISYFKVFEKISLDFSGKDFLMLDGPNGFGKTSFYDAVELLITGKIRRYRDLSEIIVDKRNVFTENPYLNADSAGCDIEIKGEIVVDGQVLVLSRMCRNAELEHSTGFEQFKLYSHDHFDAVDGVLIADEGELLRPLLGNDYILNFQFLNYVEQEDNAYLLKNKDLAKKKAIDHLFNVEVLQAKLDKIMGVRKSIAELCSPLVKKNLKAESDELKDFKKSWADKFPEVAFERVFPEHSFAWDAEDIDFQQGVYEYLFGENGELVLLKELIDNQDLYRAYLDNRKVQRILENKNLADFLRYTHFLGDRKALLAKADLFTLVESMYREIEEVTLEKIEAEELNIAEDLQEILPDELVNAYHGALERLEFQIRQAQGLEKILASIESSRTILIRNFLQFREDSDPEQLNDCPLCGHSYPDADEDSPESLMANINKQTEVLEKLLEDSQNELSRSLQAFRDEQVLALEEQLEVHMKENPLDLKFIRAMSRQQAEDFELIKSGLTAIELNASPYINQSASQDAEIDLEGFKALIESKLIPVDADRINPLVFEIFVRLFDSRVDAIVKLSTAQIDQKIAYIKWKHGLHHQTLIQQRENKLRSMQSQMEGAKDYVDQLKSLEQVYSETLKSYQKSLIRDIEILFHIYSGRIIQDFQGGLGFFIQENNGIKFLTDPSKSFDAIFTMSSGQIAALVISFTLALNKKYSRNKMLFIDDPVQTMDELNIAGFVELLRNDFNDRQIFISTHEDKMSTYMRYKFEKFGLKTKRISMKDKHI